MKEKQILLEMINAIDKLEATNTLYYNALFVISKKKSYSLEQCKQIAEKAIKEGVFIVPPEVNTSLYSWGLNKIKEMRKKYDEKYQGKELSVEELDEFFASL